MGEHLGSALLAAYGVGGRLLTPFMPAILDRRGRRGLEDIARRTERYGIAGAPRPDRSVIWVHAASVGETSAVLPLIGRLTGAGWFVILTTITVTGARTAARNPPPGVLHQFAPVDIRPWVARFLDHWRPSLALFVESEVWPVSTDELARRNIPHVIVNARISEQSFRRWRVLGDAPRRIFGLISLALAQTGADAERMEKLGVRRVSPVGNLKLDAPPPAADDDAVARFTAEIGNRPFLLAASTHPGEEEVVADAHLALADRYPGLTTAIVPRHPDRGPDIAELVATRDIVVTRRAQGEGMPAGGGIYVADTLGELGLFYRLADVAFIGGSLVPIGGHNPVEPVALGVAAIHGPHTHNFAPIYAALVEAGGSVLVASAEPLAAAVGRLFDDPTLLRHQTDAAERTLARFTGALQRTLDALQPYLAPGPVAAI
jgi:3-deoxy-D-manno-octulosonic-acid transferase